MPSPLKIGVLAEARYLAQSQPTGLYVELQARGHEIALIDPQESFYAMGSNAWLAGLDGIVARGRSWGLLGLLGWAEGAGVRTINRRDAPSPTTIRSATNARCSPSPAFAVTFSGNRTSA